MIHETVSEISECDLDYTMRTIRRHSKYKLVTVPTCPPLLPSSSFIGSSKLLPSYFNKLSTSTTITSKVSLKLIKPCLTFHTFLCLLLVNYYTQPILCQSDRETTSSPSDSRSIIRTQINYPPQDVKVILSNTAEIQCGVRHESTIPFTLKWYFNDKEISSKPASRVQILNDGTLRVEQARNTDVGIYTCSVTSTAGNDSRSARLDLVELPHPPTDVKAELNIQGGFVNVTWTPSFNGNSPITKYIVYSRVKLNTDSGSETESWDDFSYQSSNIQGWRVAQANISASQNFILIHNLRPAMTYRFRVSAVNSVGEGQPSSPSTPPVTLPAQPPSEAPIGVVGAARSSTAIMIQWQPPSGEAHNGHLLGYIIRYKLARYAETPWYHRNVTNPAQLSFHLDDLIVWQNYEIQVAAYNEMGVGAFSDSICIRTKEDRPAAAPSQVTARALSSRVIQVSWFPPDPQLINGINQGYKLAARLKNGTLFKEMHADPQHFTDRPLSSNITDLQPFTEYLITVHCYTNAGDGPANDPPINVVTEQDLPGEVESFRYWDLWDKTVDLGWTPPVQSNGELIGYTLKHYIADAPRDQWTVSNYTANTNETRIGNLKPTTFYRFEINAWTRVGPGPVKSLTIKTSIPPVLPHPPSRLAISNIGPFSVVLQFTPGFNGNASISKWIVEGQFFKLRNANWTPIYESVNNSQPNAIIVKNLRPYTEYRLRLIPFNIVGRSIEASEPSPSFQTLQAPPAHPPLNVTLRSLNATSLRVRWTPLPPESWYGQPRGYNITWFETTEENELEMAADRKFHVSGDYHSHSYTITGLEEFTNYAVQVFAINDVGTSNGSRLVATRTSEATPTTGPSNVKVTATSSTTILVEWLDIPKKHRNGVIQGFKIKYRAQRQDEVSEFKKIERNESRTATLTELKKYTLYSVSVCAFTHLGDGVYSPSFSVQTLQDVPGAPSNISFPDVTLNTARILWDIPEEPNGEILAYKVTYNLNVSDTFSDRSHELASTDRTYKVTGLQPNTYYLFSVTARTKEGWGQPANAYVYTTNNRELPANPSMPHIKSSQISSRQVTFTWKPGYDGLAPLRYYTVQVSSSGGPWITVSQRIDPSLTIYTVTGLKPFTPYQFRIRASNDIGNSNWSPESPSILTLPAPPDFSVTGVTVSPYSPTAVSVKWTPIKEWNGDEKGAGYKVQYCLVSSVVSAVHCPSTLVQGPAVTGVSIDNLERDHQYEIKVIPFNSQGEGPSSKTKIVYVGDAVPSGPPLDVKAISLSSTEVNVTWSPPENDKQNGQILGYKIFYWQSKLKPNATLTDEDSEDKREMMEIVPNTYLELSDLEMFTNYHIQVSAFNPAGDGPRSIAVFVQTKEDLPDIVGPLAFTDITMSSLRIHWDPPTKSNGILTGYYVVYETNQDDFSKQVKQTVSENHLLVKGLKEMMTYNFKVRAKTSVGMGPERSGNVTTGPQQGSPPPVTHFNFYQTTNAVRLIWKNPEYGGIIGYLIEGQRVSADSREWYPIQELRTGLIDSYDLSFANLKASSQYTFRIMTINKFGISIPALPPSANNAGVFSNLVITTPSQLELSSKLPFYFENWFITSAASILALVLVVFFATICVCNTVYKYKQEAKKRGSHDALSENEFGLVDNLHNPYASGFELRQNTMRSQASRRSTNALNSINMAAAKCPPRPSPGSITYSDEEVDEDTKDANLYCSSGDSVTEKPSELSSSGPESDSEHDDIYHFVNHYANVNDTLNKNQPSWKRGAASYVVQTSASSSGSGSGSAIPRRPPPPAPGPAPPSYNAAITSEDSELDCPSVNLNGGRIIINNMAGSRAPLPGFSSFV